MPPLPFDEKIATSCHLSVLARRFFDMWWLYESSDSKPQIVDAIRRYPEFFRFDSHAHLVSAVGHLSMLFESRQDTVNFGALIREARNNALIDAAEIAKADAMLQAVSELRKKVGLSEFLCVRRFLDLSLSAARG